MVFIVMLVLPTMSFAVKDVSYFVPLVLVMVNCKSTNPFQGHLCRAETEIVGSAANPMLAHICASIIVIIDLFDTLFTFPHTSSGAPLSVRTTKRRTLFPSSRIGRGAETTKHLLQCITRGA